MRVRLASCGFFRWGAWRVKAFCRACFPVPLRGMLLGLGRPADFQRFLFILFVPGYRLPSVLNAQSVVAYMATTLAECISPDERAADYNHSCQMKAARRLPSTYRVAVARTRKHGASHGTHSARCLRRRFRCRLQGPPGCRQEERPRCIKTAPIPLSPRPRVA